MTNSKISNRLANEKSPYLLQHAYNPVDWWPWCEEAFAKANTEDKPIFLSIGYSTCHWCHVMENESFEDLEVAEILNTNFISIKVDREERADIDSVYMSVCQALTGSGGWPLTIIMTPDKNPFFAGTYFPKHRKFGHSGIIELLNTISEKWKTEKSTLLNTGETIAKEISKLSLENETTDFEITAKPIFDALGTLESIFDEDYGGFGNAPKFPSPHNLMFILDCYEAKLENSYSNKLINMVEKTLDSMYQGGIFDHVGYGFSRYSTDIKWLVPHFEKMLYDNALLVILYTQIYEITRKDIYAYVAEKTLEYTSREMTSLEGGFYCAQDADSDGEEGKFYTWDYNEVISILGKTDGEYICNLYDISKNGNFEGKNILNRIHDSDISIPNEKTELLLSVIRKVRAERFTLHKDDKILTSWNALMIVAFAKAGKAFDNPNYIGIAENAMDFLEKHLTYSNGDLAVSYRNGETTGKGLLDDYSYLTWASLTLYENTYKPKYLKKAIDIISLIEKKFSNTTNGFYMSPSDSETLLYRPKEFYDGAMPSGNSIAAYCITKLASLTEDAHLKELSYKQINAFSSFFNNHPTACTFALRALIYEVGVSKELICVVNDISEIKSLRINDMISLNVITPENKDELLEILPHLKEYTKLNSLPVFFLCENKSCSAPIYDIETLISRIN